jgi:hypothetical protein
MKYEILNTREKKRIIEALQREYKLSTESFSNLAFVKKEDEIWVTTPHVLSLQISEIPKSFGLQLMRSGVPTIAAVQLFFSSCEKTELPIDDAEKFIEGETVNASGKIASYKGHPIDITQKDKNGIKRLRRN